MAFISTAAATRNMWHGRARRRRVFIRAANRLTQSPYSSSRPRPQGRAERPCLDMQLQIAETRSLRYASLREAPVGTTGTARSDDGSATEPFGDLARQHEDGPEAHAAKARDHGDPEQPGVEPTDLEPVGEPPVVQQQDLPGADRAIDQRGDGDADPEDERLRHGDEVEAGHDRHRDHDKVVEAVRPPRPAAIAMASQVVRPM